MGRGDPRAPQGHVRAEPVGGGVLARRAQGGRAGRRADHQHVVDVGAVRQPGAEQLRRGEVGHRDVLDHRGQGARPLRRDRERDRARGADAHDREPRWRIAAAPEPGEWDERAPGQHRAARRLARERGVGRRSPGRCSSWVAAAIAIAQGWQRGPGVDRGARWDPARARTGRAGSRRRRPKRDAEMPKARNEE